MKLTTIRTPNGTRAGLVENGEVVLLPHADVRAVLEEAEGSTVEAVVRLAARGERMVFGSADFAPIVPRPEKIVCVGLNYRSHIEEMGRALPEYPTLFAKYARALIGARDPIALPAESSSVDWEVELTIVIGRTVRRARGSAALDAIAGFTVMNDISMRDWQNRTLQFLGGKTWDASTPVGPVFVTRDEIGDGLNLGLRTEVDGVVMQESNTSDLLFGPVELVEYISTLVTLEPGDLIATGTPDGVGAGRKPPVFLRPGNVLRTSIDGIGTLENSCRAE